MARRPPPVALVLAAVGSVQFGAALAATLFDELGPAGASFLRIAFAAVILTAVWRPRLGGHTAAELGLAAVFGLLLAAMNTCFYLALDRIPLGITVTLEFVGPLGVAVAASRRALDLVWVALAGGGIAILSGWDVGGLDPVGIGLALTAGCLWGAYILLSVRLGRAFPRGNGLAVALVIGTVAMIPAGIADADGALGEPDLLGIAVAVALLSSVIPYSLELEALRRMPARVFGVLMSLEPAVGALAGFLVLDQDLAALEGLAIGLVVVASAGAALSAREGLVPAEGPVEPVLTTGSRSG
jgi:inner membrane transporter RhtA